jgi:hypothetical protein
MLLLLCALTVCYTVSEALEHVEDSSLLRDKRNAYTNLNTNCIQRGAACYNLKSQAYGKPTATYCRMMQSYYDCVLRVWTSSQCQDGPAAAQFLTEQRDKQRQSMQPCQ